MYSNIYSFLIPCHNILMIHRYFVIAFLVKITPIYSYLKERKNKLFTFEKNEKIIHIRKIE